MIRQAALLTIAFAFALPTTGAAAEDPRETVIAAATSFSVGYGVWLMEKRCNILPPDKRKAFDAVVGDVLTRLQAAADARLFNATIGAGRDVSNDPHYADCKELATGGMVDFGIGLVGEAAAKLASLPEGYHLTISD